MESLQKQLSSQTSNPEALDKLQKDLEKLQEAAKALADKTGRSARTPSGRSCPLRCLRCRSRRREAGVQLPQLDEAIAALAANQTDRFLKDLDAALTDLEKLRDMKQEA